MPIAIIWRVNFSKSVLRFLITVHSYAFVGGTKLTRSTLSWSVLLPVLRQQLMLRSSICPVMQIVANCFIVVKWRSCSSYSEIRFRNELNLNRTLIILSWRVALISVILEASLAVLCVLANLFPHISKSILWNIMDDKKTGDSSLCTDVKNMSNLRIFTANALWTNMCICCKRFQLGLIVGYS